MKLNPDCIRDVLRALEEKFIPDEDGDVEPITAEELCDSELLKKYPRSEILYTVRSLFKEKLIEEGVSYVTDSFPRLADLTPEGRKFLEVTREDAKWGKIKEATISTGATIVTELLKIGISLIAKT